MPDLSEFKKIETPPKVKPVVSETKDAASQSNIQSDPSVNDLDTQAKAKTSTPKPPQPETKKKPSPKAKPKAKAKAAKISFEKTTHNFGEITEGDVIKHKFKFTNTGNAELTIKSASASCGCTDPSYPFLGIAPGEDGFIGVTYYSVSKDGPQKPEVTIKTNASDHSFVLYLEGNVIPKKKEDEKVEEQDSSSLIKKK